MFSESGYPCHLTRYLQAKHKRGDCEHDKAHKLSSAKMHALLQQLLNHKLLLRLRLCLLSQQSIAGGNKKGKRS